MYDPRPYTLNGCPYHINTDEDFAVACDRCEIKVRISASGVRELKPLPKYDKRLAGTLGRSLIQAVPSLGLLVGDRLEPSKELPDVGMLDGLSLARGRASQLTLWRRANETCAFTDFHFGPRTSGWLP